MSDRIALLQGMALFGALDRSTVDVIQRHALTVDRVADEHFFRFGDVARSMFVLQSGRVGIYRSWHGVDKLLRTHGRGESFGEISMMDLGPRSASAVALEPSRAIEITAETLQRVYEHDRQQYLLIQMNMGREMARRVRQTGELLFRTLMGEPPAEGAELAKPVSGDGMSGPRVAADRDGPGEVAKTG